MHRRVLRYGDRVLVTVASVALTLQGLDWPPRFWDDHSYLLVPSLAVIVIFGIFQPFDAVFGRKTALDRERAWRRGLDALDAMQSASLIDFRDLSLHVWLPRRSLRARFRYELRRPISIRIGHQGMNRDVRFTQPKGVVGRCWATNSEQSRDLRADFANVNSAQDWENLTASQGAGYTMHFTYEEFELTRHISAVLAVPIHSKRLRFKGCVSADTTAGTLTDLVKAFPAVRSLAADLLDYDLDRLNG
jgi:hypothetical protein